MNMLTNSNSERLQELRQLYKNDGTAKAVLDDFAGRQRNQNVTKVERLATALSATDHSYHDVLKVLRRLGKLGYGNFVPGRKGHKSRMVWQVGIVSLGIAATGTRDDIETLFDGDVGDDDDADSPVPPMPLPMSAGTPQGSPSGAKRVVYILRREFDAELIVPKDFSRVDADRLIQFIKTLPFDEMQGG